ncbi:NAD-dependent epimerase/dehydratase family protein [Paramicrobacterium fandaimingii]|uniref:NAD-dependent epimerase/dehydratase family protein n=1 Tax=Paramicrobacterium fandaimingii TaxID=2708079 RepID=UPI001420B297|nr:NAD-dependent epimerase/dehydratase family protein [Microbacterium fandaimingii]
MGSNVAAQFDFDDLYNSKNISDIRGKSYDLVVSAGNRADSFRINNNQEDDLQEVDQLADHLEKASIGELVLMSTVCVYPGNTAPNEETPLSPEGLTPYGQNRLHQEQRLSSTFKTRSIRLPQLLGNGLKKGIIYDLSNNYRVEFINPQGRFQYYDIRNLWSDISLARSNDIDALNIAPPPLTSAAVAKECFGVDIALQTPPGPESEFSKMYTKDMRTVFADLWGEDGPYIMSRSAEFSMISDFVTSQSK